MEALYNPTVEANLMSDEFTLAFLGNMTLTPTYRQLKRPSGSLLNSYGVLKNVLFWHGDVKVHLNFHVFEGLDFDFMIGHPIKAFLEDTLKSGCLNVRIGRESFPIPISRSTNYLVEDPPTIEPIEEVMATSILNSSDSDLKEDIEGNPEEVIKEDEDFDEIFELPRLKSHHDSRLS